LYVCFLLPCYLLVTFRDPMGLNGPSVVLTNTTLLLPPQEARQLQALAAAAAQGLPQGFKPSFQLSYPSGACGAEFKTCAEATVCQTWSRSSAALDELAPACAHCSSSL
jgi:hypothetical protein